MRWHVERVRMWGSPADGVGLRFHCLDHLPCLRRRTRTSDGTCGIVDNVEPPSAASGSAKACLPSVDSRLGAEDCASQVLAGGCGPGWPATACTRRLQKRVRPRRTLVAGGEASWWVLSVPIPSQIDPSAQFRHGCSGECLRAERLLRTRRSRTLPCPACPPRHLSRRRGHLDGFGVGLYS